MGIINKTRISKIIKSGNTIYYSAESLEMISESQALELQKCNGYHPAGYGFYDFKCTVNDKTGLYEANWNSFSSCD